LIHKRRLLAGALFALAAAAALVVRPHTATATTSTLVAPNGVRCMAFVAVVEPPGVSVDRLMGMFII